MNTSHRILTSSIVGLSILGAGIGLAGAANAAPGDQHRPQPGQSQPNHPNQQHPNQPNRPNQPNAHKSNGQNPNWRPGPVQRDGRQHQPVWDQGKNHWGFWLGPVWVPVG